MSYSFLYHCALRPGRAAAWGRASRASASRAAALRARAQEHEAFKMNDIFQERLGIGQRELQTIEWHEVVARLVALQESGKYRIAKKRPQPYERTAASSSDGMTSA